MRSSFVVGVMALLPACYQAHGFDAPSDPDSCAPPGRYAMDVTVGPATATCMATVAPGWEIDIPPSAAVFPGASSVEIVQVDTCRWELLVETLAPDLSSTMSGTIDASDGMVRGTLDVAVTGFAGPICEVTLALEER